MTPEERAESARLRREARREAKMCITAAAHGRATRGLRCDACSKADRKRQRYFVSVKPDVVVAARRAAAARGMTLAEFVEVAIGDLPDLSAELESRTPVG